MRTMYDGINADAAPIAKAFPQAAMVAGYANGAYAWSAAEWALFPAAEHVTISVTASADEGDVLDVEKGDATPAQTEAWIAMRKAAGLYRPTVYCDLATVPAVRTGTGKYVLGTDYDLWVADYDGSTASTYAGCAAKQYATTSTCDISAVYDDAWPHRVPPSQVPPAPAGMSATPWVLADLGWSAVSGASHYRYQVAAGTPDRLGTVTATAVVDATHAAAVKLGAPGAYCWRVQAGGGDWSAWRQLALLGAAAAIRATPTSTTGAAWTARCARARGGAGAGGCGDH